MLSYVGAISILVPVQPHAKTHFSVLVLTNGTFASFPALFNAAAAAAAFASITFVALIGDLGLFGAEEEAGAVTPEDLFDEGTRRDKAALAAAALGALDGPG